MPIEVGDRVIFLTSDRRWSVRKVTGVVSQTSLNLAVVQPDSSEVASGTGVPELTNADRVTKPFPQPCWRRT
jgi:hypothetical protein